VEAEWMLAVEDHIRTYHKESTLPSKQKTAPDIQVTKFNYLKKGQEMKKLCSPSGPLPSVFSIALFKVNFAHCCLLLEKIKRKLHLALILIVSN